MNFLWPQYLWLMLALPAAAGAVPLAAAPPRQAGAALQQPAARPRGVDAATGGGTCRRRCCWIACSLLLFAAARPVATLTLPWARSTIMLAMDVSLSMRVTDVKPTRLAAAQEAAKTFLRDLPPDIDVGLVTFAGSTQVAQRATLDRASLVSAIDAFQMQIGTAVGNAIVLCLAELFPDQGIDLAEMTFGHRQKAAQPRRQGQAAAEADHAGGTGFLRFRGDHPAERRPPHHRRRYAGSREDGRRPRRAHLRRRPGHRRRRGLRPEGMAIYLRLDEPTLREVARMTGGEYHHAGTAEKLRSVYEKLGSRVQVQTRETELAPLLALAAAILVLAAASLSMLWFGSSSRV